MGYAIITDDRISSMAAIHHARVLSSFICTASSVCSTERRSSAANGMLEQAYGTPDPRPLFFVPSPSQQLAHVSMFTLALLSQRAHRALLRGGEDDWLVSALIHSTCDIKCTTRSKNDRPRVTSMSPFRTMLSSSCLSTHSIRSLVYARGLDRQLDCSPLTAFQCFGGRPVAREGFACADVQDRNCFARPYTHMHTR